MTTRDAKSFCEEGSKTPEDIKDFLFKSDDFINNFDIIMLKSYCDRINNQNKTEVETKVINDYEGSYCNYKLNEEYKSDKNKFCNTYYTQGCNKICHNHKFSNNNDLIYIENMKQGEYYIIYNIDPATNWKELDSEYNDNNKKIYKRYTKFRASRDGQIDDGKSTIELSTKDEDEDITNNCVNTTKSNLKTFGVAFGHSLGQLSGFGPLIDQYTSETDGYNWGPSKVKQLQSKLETLKWVGIKEIMKAQIGGTVTQYDDEGNKLSDKKDIDGVDTQTLKDINTLMDTIDRFDLYIKTKLDSEIKTFNYTNMGSLILLYVISFVLLSLTVWKLK